MLLLRNVRKNVDLCDYEDLAPTERQPAEVDYRVWISTHSPTLPASRNIHQMKRIVTGTEIATPVVTATNR
jgi:hypothetical protein